MGRSRCGARLRGAHVVGTVVLGVGLVLLTILWPAVSRREDVASSDAALAGVTNRTVLRGEAWTTPAPSHTAHAGATVTAAPAAGVRVHTLLPGDVSGHLPPHSSAAATTTTRFHYTAHMDGGGFGGRTTVVFVQTLHVLAGTNFSYSYALGADMSRGVASLVFLAQHHLEWFWYRPDALALHRSGPSTAAQGTWASQYNEVVHIAVDVRQCFACGGKFDVHVNLTVAYGALATDSSKFVESCTDGAPQCTLGKLRSDLVLLVMPTLHDATVSIDFHWSDAQNRTRAITFGLVLGLLWLVLIVLGIIPAVYFCVTWQSPDNKQAPKEDKHKEQQQQQYHQKTAGMDEVMMAETYGAGAPGAAGYYAQQQQQQQQQGCDVAPSAPPPDYELAMLQSGGGGDGATVVPGVVCPPPS